MKQVITALSAAAAMALATPALADQKGDITFGLGLGMVQPKSDNGTLAGSKVTVGDNTQPTLTLEYFIQNNLGLEVLAATPFKHDISLGGTKIGSTKHLPPTISLNYHVPTSGKLQPFVGVGLNYTAFFSTKSSLGTLDLKNTFGAALHAGLDYKLDPRNAIRADLRWIHIKPDVYLNGSKLGSVDISPMVYGISWVHQF